MERNELIKQLNSLSKTKAGGQPRDSWLRDRRAVLMEQADEAMTAAPKEQDNIQQLRFAMDMGMGWQKALRPVLASFVAMMLIFGGWVATVSASYDSLPGDVLYSVKLVTERAQLTISPSREKKARLRIDFAGRRLDEVSKLVDNPIPEKENKINVAMDSFKKDIETVNKDLDEIKNQKDSKKAVEVAKDVERKADSYGETLKKTMEKAPEENKQKAKEAKAVVEEVSVKAVELMVEKHIAGEGEAITEDELIEKIGNKLKKTEDDISEVEAKLLEIGIDEEIEELEEEAGATEEAEASSTEEVIDEEADLEESDEESGELDEDEEAVDEPAEAEEATTDEVKQKLAEAKELLDSKDYAGAMEKVKEANSLASAIEDTVDEAEAAAETDSPAETIEEVEGEGSASSTADTIEGEGEPSTTNQENSSTTEEVVDGEES